MGDDGAMTPPEPNRDADPGSITRWLGPAKTGDAAAIQALWERYFSRLVTLARGRLRNAPRARLEGDEEDAALSAFDSFVAGAARGRFPQLDDRDDLWRLLVVITRRKASAMVDRQRARKRGGDRPEAAHARDDDDGPDALAQLVSQEPTPEFAAAVAEQVQIRLDALGRDDLRQIALWRLEGYDRDEIAERLGCARRTVARRLDLIRALWSDAEASSK
jgi:DNA-directed RNA polymerase specialized sigma24 family protein